MDGQSESAVYTTVLLHVKEKNSRKFYSRSTVSTCLSKVSHIGASTFSIRYRKSSLMHMIKLGFHCVESTYVLIIKILPK